MFCLSLVLTYEVYILTGDKLGAGTKAAVKLTIFGEYGNSGERQLLRSRTHRSKFQRGQVGRSRIGAKNRNPHIFVLNVCCIFTKIIYFTSRGPFNKVLYGDVPSRSPTAYSFIFYHFWQKRYPFSIPSTEKWYQFQFISLLNKNKSKRKVVLSVDMYSHIKQRRVFSKHLNESPYLFDRFSCPFIYFNS